MCSRCSLHITPGIIGGTSFGPCRRRRRLGNVTLMETRNLCISSLVTLLAIGGTVETAQAAAPFAAFESGQVRPLAMNSSRTRLYAVNTPDNRLEVYKIKNNGGLEHEASVPVG